MRKLKPVLVAISVALLLLMVSGCSEAARNGALNDLNSNSAGFAGIESGSTGNTGASAREVPEAWEVTTNALIDISAPTQTGSALPTSGNVGFSPPPPPDPTNNWLNTYKN